MMQCVSMIIEWPESPRIVMPRRYITLFAASFPLAALLVLINNLTEIRGDASRRGRLPLCCTPLCL